MSGRKRCPSDEMDSSGPNSPPSYADEFEECEAVSNFKKKKDELEIFMDRMKEVKYEREDVQRKTFGKWMNSMLAKGGHPLVKDLFNDLKDGTKLLSLLEVLTNKTFKREKGKMRVHHLNNVSRALEVLRENNVRLVNISNNDIVDGNAKITLALAWSVFLHWQVNDIMKHLMASTHQSNLEKALISWCQTNTKPYPGVDIKNFSTSWSDGLAFAALIHRWRPEVIDFANIASKTDHSERLDTVFKIAQDVLGIERLLDPEDVNTTIPDKKSVMMYVMCLFQALAHSGLDPPPLPSAEELEEEIKQEVAKQEAEAHKPPSIELTSYQNIVEEVLSWLLIADDRISSMDDISEELNEVKGQFQEHEKFMLTLTDHQGDVGEVLQEGSRLLQESKIPVNEMEEVKVQMKLLNTKWEELRVKAMDRQNKIHEKLMTLQLTELEALKEFLTSTEDRISRMGSPPLDDVEALEENLKEQHELHQDILKQQERVVAFSNLVVVVDENNPDTDFSNMEDQLAALSERWTHICGWTEKRGKLLKQLRTEMPEFHRQQRHLEEWLQMQEKRLKEVEANPNDATQESLMERYDKLQLLQGEMEEKMKEISDLQTSVQTLIESESATTIDDKLSDITSGSKFLDKIEGLQDRWEALSQIMEAQSQRISKYGAQIKCNKKSLSVVSPLIETNVEMVDILSLSRQQDFPKAKRTKIMNEWENSYGQVNEWILRTESLIEVCPGSTTTTFDELSVDEQLILWEDLESEQSENEGVYNQAITDSTALIKYMKQEGQDTFDLEEQVKSMTDKWENVKEVLTNRKLLIDYLLAKKQVQGEIASMTGILAAYEKWLDSQGEVSPISNQPRKLLEQCRVKKKTIHSHESRVNKLKVKSDELLAMESHIGSDEELKTEATNFTSKWNLIVQRLNERLTQLESMDKMSAEEKYTESSQQILQWITGTENFLATNAGAGDEIKLMDLKVMRVQQKQLKEFLVEAKNHEENLSTIQKNNAAPDDLMDELRTRYSEVKAVLEEKSIHLDALILKMEQWLAEMTGLESWLEEVDVFVCAETPAIGDADVLDAQLEQSNALEEDVTTLEPKFTSLNATGKTLLSETDDSLTQIMKARIMKLNSHWTETVRKAKEQNVLLKDAYEKTKQVLRGVSETSEWLTQLSRDAPKLGTINTPADLARLARKFQALKDRVDKREASFRLLNDRGNELLLMHQTQCKDDAKRAATIQELARTFTTLNARWTEITGTVDRNCILLKDASLLYGDFRSKTAQAMDWLDRLEKKLRKSVTSAADVEELSEDIDDIEQYVGNQQEARLVKIQNIGRELIQDGILVNSIQTDVQQLTNRWTLLNQQAQQRKMELEGEMGEAQQWERNVQQLCEWVETTDKILSTRLEHDLSAEDLPNDTEQLSDELVQQEKVLQDMADQVQVYRKANKLEAAARLKEQKDMLQARFEEVQSKFTKFSSPPPESKIYAKIERIWRSLRQVEQALCFLELASEDPESIQGQLNHCTKEYATLSELKRDVEMVLREGRRQVEDKKADVKLSAELDSMKALYNKLGMQIANIRNSLEKGLTVSTQMNEQMSSLELWLEESETQLGGQFQDKNSEMDFLRGRTEELPRWTKIIEEFNRNYDNFLKLVDPVLLDSLKERRFMILQKWETLSQELVKKHEANLKDISLPELEDKQQSVVGELEDWLEKAENFLNKMTNEAVMFSDDEIFELQALNEDLTERSDRLDALRDETIDLIVTKGDPFSVDNPENITLQRLTHRLESIGNQLHNLSSCIVLDEEGEESGGVNYEEIPSSSLSSRKYLGDQEKDSTLTPRRLSSEPDVGICNLAFDFEDEEEEQTSAPSSRTISAPKKHQIVTIHEEGSLEDGVADLEAENLLEVEVPLPQQKEKKAGFAASGKSYSIENVPEVSVTLSRSGHHEIIKTDTEQTPFTPTIEKPPEEPLVTENIDLASDEDFEDVEMLMDLSLSTATTVSDASTVVPSEQPQSSKEMPSIPPPKPIRMVRGSVSNSKMWGSVGGGGSGSGNLLVGNENNKGSKGRPRSCSESSTHTPLRSRSPQEGNIKIVEIKSNEIVQGILRMEPTLSAALTSKERVALVKVPMGQSQSRGGGSRGSRKKSGPKEWAGETLKESEEVIVPEVKREKREVKSFSVQLSSATSSPSGQLKDKEIFAFEVEGQAICATMARMAEKLEEIDQDDDPGRRREALEMELNAVEPEVALTISKGDSLVFKISKSNIHKANQIRAALDLLRSDWIQLKTRAEGQRMAALRLEATQLECQGMMQQLEDWIADSMNTPKSDRKSLQPEWEKKSEEFKILRKKIEELRKRNIRGLNADLKILEDKWKKLEKSFPEHGRRGGGASVKEKGSRIPVPQTKSTTAVGVAQKQIETQTSAPPKQTITKAAIWTPELVTKVNRLREQVATISRSMAAAEDPMTVKEELEKLSIRVQEMETLEGEGLKGGTSEQMIQGQRVIQKLLDEWATVNMTVGQMLLRSPPSKSPSPSPSPGPKVIGSPESNDILDLEVWLDEIEGMMKEWKTTSATAASGDAGLSGEEAKLKLKEMEAKISKRHRSVMLLMSKKSRMSPANDDSARKIDKIGYRWRNLLAEMTIRRDRLCGEVGDHRILLSKWWEPHVVLRDWIQRATDALEAPVRISDDPSLKNSLSNLKSLEHEMGGKIPDLEKLRQNKRHYVTEEEIQEFREQIDKLTLELPLRRKFVEAKLMSLRKLTSQLDTTTSWVLEVRAQVATAKHRPPQERAAAIESIMIRVEDKGAEVLDVVRNYINLDKECEFNDQFMAPHMVEKIRQLKEDWLYVKSRGEINILTPASDKKFFDVQVAMTPPSFHSTPGGREGGRDAEGNSPTAPVGHTLWSPSPINQSQESSLSELRSTEQKESALLLGHSPQSASAFAFQFTPQATIQQIIKEIEGVEDSMTLNLKCLKQQTVIVGDVEDIRNVLEKQKIVLRELELKKPQLDELMLTAENLKSESTRHNLHGKVSKLREHWTETNEAVIKRKSQLEQCLGDSAHWDGQMKDVDSWLGHMENRLDSLPPLEPSDPHFQQFKNEVQQYKRQVDGLSLMTQRLSASYHQDDTFRIKRAGEQINHRYNQLCTRVSYGPGSGIRGNGYGLGTGGRSSTLPTIDRQLEAQIGWIAERERALDAIESEIQRLGPPLHHPNTNSTPRGNPLQKLKELQIELESHAATVAALGNSGRATASEVDRTPSDAGALLQRLDEMNHRWHALKQRSMAIRSRLESNTEHWHALLLSLREIIEWVIRKDTELIGFGPLAGDVATVQRQIDEHRNFRRQLEGKRPVIETNLISGRQHVANEPVSSDLGSDGDIMDGDARGYRSAEVAARELTRSIRREVTKLNETWLTLLSRSDNWQRSLEDGVMRLRAFQQMLDDGSARLATAEAIKSRWPTIAAAADKSTLLDQLKTFREHISSTQRAMTEINEESGDLMNAGILLGGTNVSRVDDLNVRLKNLQLTVVERETELVASIGAGGSGVASVMAVIPPTSHASVEPPWEKALTPSKVPYYINHENESTQWDHPHMSSLLNSLTVYNDVRFSAYRTALKLRALQKEIRLDKLPLKCVIETFDSLGLRGHNDRLLDVPDMVSTLSTLYSTCSTTEAMSGTMDTVKGPGDGAPLVIPLVTDLAVNWLLNVYDSQRTGQLRNLSFKIGIVLLCKGPMEDKFRYLFRLVADAAKQVDQRKLGLLLHDCMQIPRQLGEVAAFGGSNIEPSVRSCYEKAPKDKTTIQVGHFLEWVKQEPQSLVWLPVLHRIAAAEGARHQAKCNVCKQVPILGLRYRCLKCFNFDMCQRCFFSGKKAKNHKLTHPMQEYCTESTSGEDVRDFTRALKNRFKSKRSLQKHRKLGYLPVQTVLEGDMLESPAPSPQHSLSPEIHSRLPDNYASRLLGDVDGRNRTNSTPDSEDEHSLIAQYCQSLTRGDNVIPQSPIQIVAAIDAEQSEQLEAVIRALEEENASLQAEYERLRHKSQTNGQLVGSIASPTHSDTDQIQNGRNYYPSLESTNENNNILAEARLLRQHKGRLEARMQILEDHNRQLEAQLQRLRQLLDEPKPNSPSKTGTLQSKSVVAAELATDSPLPHRANGHSHSAHQGGWHSSSQERSGYHEESRLPPPPTPGYSVSGASLEDSGHSGKPLG